MSAYDRSCVRSPGLARWIDGFLYIGNSIVAPRTLRSGPTATASWVVDTAERLGELVVTLGEILRGVATREWVPMTRSLDLRLPWQSIRFLCWPPDNAQRSRLGGALVLHQPTGIVALVRATPDYVTNREAIERLVDLLLCNALARLHRRLQPTEATQPSPPVSGPSTRGTYRTAWQLRHLISVLDVFTEILGRRW